MDVHQSTFQKLKRKSMHYRDYKQFSNDEFRKKLIWNLSLENALKDFVKYA